MPQNTNPAPAPVPPFTVCPRCNYPHKDAHQVRAGRSGGKAKVKKGFASPAVQAKAQATRAAQREAKAKASADATAKPIQ